jgi:hypothetical protein
MMIDVVPVDTAVVGANLASPPVPRMGDPGSRVSAAAGAP